MKTINLIALALFTFIFSASFSSDSYSNNSYDVHCKYCDATCTANDCCIKADGTSQGNTDCCTDKCTNEKCKELCAGGNCSMSEIKSGSVPETDQTNQSTIKSCCSDKSETEMKDCNK